MRLSYGFELKDGQPVIGYGYYPFVISPAEALTLNPGKDQASVQATVGDYLGDVTITSPLDASLNRVFTFVSPAQVDGIMISSNFKEVDRSFGATVTVAPAVGGLHVCDSSLAFTFTNNSPEDCVIRPGLGSRIEIEVEPGARDAERCDFALSFAAARGGQGVTQQFSLPIKQR